MSTHWFPNKFSEDIWFRKYAGDYKDIDIYFRDLAKAVSLNNERQETEFYRLFMEKKFSPGGRILAWAGNKSAKVSLMNCTTHAVEEDSLEAIADSSYFIMRASSRGQGVGIDLSKLRPKGAKVDNSAKTSTGSISFMELLNHSGKIIGQEGRRAALLFSLNVDHPDLWREGEQDIPCSCEGKGCMKCKGTGFLPYDFLSIKHLNGKVDSANISVNISDAFMRAVKGDRPWTFSFENGKEQITKTVSAKKLFSELARSAYLSAEPGVLFVDNTAKYSNSDLFGERWRVVGVNACTEQLLDQNGVCNLGSMNLAAYVNNPFEPNATFDFGSFEEDTKLAIRFLDNIIDIEIKNNLSISQKQREALIYLRRVGLGVMGLADTLSMLGLPYKPQVSTLTFLRRLFTYFRDATYEASIELSNEFGAAKVWEDITDKEMKRVLWSGFFQTLPEHLKQGIKTARGTRNVTTMSIAPTGSISNLFGVSSGIEPLFDLEYMRRLKMNGNEGEFITYVHPAVEISRSKGLDDSIWLTANEVSPSDHVLMQAAIQHYIDQSISKTTNLSREATVKDVEEIYLLAHRVGLKGITVYVDGSRNEQILYHNDTCPVCEDGGNIIHSSGCKECSVCGWSICT